MSEKKVLEKRNNADIAERSVVLKAKREKPLLNRHHWIFSGAIAAMPCSVKGEILPVYSAEKKFLGRGYFHKSASISGRMITFEEEPVETTLGHLIGKAIELRQELFDLNTTNCFRLINGEGDFLPGLIVDRYNDTLVIQSSTLGMDNLLPMVIQHLQKLCQPRAIYEKSTSFSRREESLEPQKKWHLGKSEGNISARENGLQFLVDVEEGQKSGFFLDQRQMRQVVKNLAHGKRVLNCFSYTAGFSVYALSGGAISVSSLDSSSAALKMGECNVALNENGQQWQKVHHSIESDAFDYLAKEQILPYDLVILDPPAFAKKEADIVKACRGYKELNRLVLSKVPAKSLLLSCSCSYHISSELFQTVLFQAAREANRKVRILRRHEQASDHPINICHKEGEYLKSLLLYIE